MTSRVPGSSEVWRVIAAASTGLLLAASFAPLDWWRLAWLGLVPLLLVCRFTAPRSSFKFGFLAGVVFWLLSISWLLSLSKTGGPWWLVVPGWLSLSGYSALFFGCFATVSSWLMRQWLCDGFERGQQEPLEQELSPKPVTGSLAGNFGLLFAIPLTWVGFEYLRSTIFTGFPWNALGISQANNISAIQGAEWGGVYIVSAVIVLLNVSLMLVVLRVSGIMVRTKQRPVRADILAGLLLCACYLAMGRSAARSQEKSQFLLGVDSIQVAAVQPNVPQLKKWPEQFESEIYGRLGRETERALAADPDLIVWPETAVPTVLMDDMYAMEFVAKYSTSGVPLLVGTLEEDADRRGRPALYNSAFLFGGEGQVINEYRKLHLVPFGEHLPFEDQFDFIKNLAPLGFTCAAGRSNVVFRLKNPDTAFSALICFEDGFANLSRRAVLEGARFLVNLTNDAWFDGTSGAVQHLRHCVFRCVENRVPAVRSANTGVTCFIDSVGRVDVLSQSGEVTGFAGTKVGSMSVSRGDVPLTFYSRYGDLPFALPAGIASALAFLLVLISEKKKILA